MKRILTALVVLQAAWLTAWADGGDMLMLKNGSRQTGYIAVQMPGKQIVFQSDGQISVFNWEDISGVEFPLRDPELETGLVDIIETRDGKVYRGQITMQTFGQSVTMATDDGVVTIDNANIRAQKKEKLSPDYSLFEQAPYENTVTTDKEKVSGIITLQDYGDDNNEPYIIVMTDFDMAKRVLVADITQIARRDNKHYKEVWKFKAEAGKVYVNQQELTPYETQQQKKSKGEKGARTFTKKKGLLVVDEQERDTWPVVTADNGKITVEAGFMAAGTQRFLLSRIQKMEMGKYDVYAFDPEEIYVNSVEPSLSTTLQGGTIHKEYNVHAGTYIFYEAKTGKAYCFVVQ